MAELWKRVMFVDIHLEVFFQLMNTLLVYEYLRAVERQEEVNISTTKGLLIIATAAMASRELFDISCIKIHNMKLQKAYSLEGIPASLNKVIRTYVHRTSDLGAPKICSD